MAVMEVLRPDFMGLKGLGLVWVSRFKGLGLDYSIATTRPEEKRKKKSRHEKSTW